MKKFFISIFAILLPITTMAAEGWPANYGGVMLQGFYWDSCSDTPWVTLEKQSDELSTYFSLIWTPPSGYCNTTSTNVGYYPVWFFNQNSSWGTENELRSMIKTFKEKGTGILADVVVNHHSSLSGWVDFAEETYKGETYQLQSTDICSNDEAASWAKDNGVSLSSNPDTGDNDGGCRDLDHKSENVQKIIKAYEDFLLNDMGYTGFRYDMVKGYSASFVGEYNSVANPEFSVGEYWDGNASAVQRWIDGTKVDDQIQSAAFDFAFRYTCRDAANNQKWSSLNNTESNTNKDYQRYSITFVENHDTQVRSSSEQQDPIRCDTLALNAWLLANPGTPCVFWKHWRAYKREIKQMIEARRMIGITNQSDIEKVSSSASCVSRKVKGTNGTLLVVVGNDASTFSIPRDYVELFSGHHYRYLVSSDCDTSSWADIMARIEEEEKPQPFDPTTATVHVCADFSPVYFYVWDSNDNTQLNGNWPGKQQTETTEIGGKTWYYQTFDITSADYYFNIIFNQGSGKPQTDDIKNVSSDKFYIATLTDSKIEIEDVTSDYLTAIDDVVVENTDTTTDTYNLAGQKVGDDYRGIIIKNGKKQLRK